MEALNALSIQQNEVIWAEGYYILTNILEPIIPHASWELSKRLFELKNFENSLSILNSKINQGINNQISHEEFSQLNNNYNTVVANLAGFTIQLELLKNQIADVKNNAATLDLLISFIIFFNFKKLFLFHSCSYKIVIYFNYISFKRNALN